MLWSGTSPAPAYTGVVVGERRGRRKREDKGIEKDESEDMEDSEDVEEVVRTCPIPEHRSTPRPPASAILQNGIPPFRIPQQSASYTIALSTHTPGLHIGTPGGEEGEGWELMEREEDRPGSVLSSFFFICIYFPCSLPVLSLCSALRREEKGMHMIDWRAQARGA